MSKSETYVKYYVDTVHTVHYGALVAERCYQKDIERPYTIIYKVDTYPLIFNSR
jgi:hypothetical protein